MKARTKVTAQHSFARVLGKRPRIRAASYTAIDHPNLLAETFGPPEMTNQKSSTLIFWNFVRNDGAKRFTLFARVRPKSRPSEVEVHLVADAGVRSFREWTSDKLSVVEGGEEVPLFVGAGAFAIARL